MNCGVDSTSSPISSVDVASRPVRYLNLPLTAFKNLSPWRRMLLTNVFKLMFSLAECSVEVLRDPWLYQCQADSKRSPGCLENKKKKKEKRKKKKKKNVIYIIKWIIKNLLAIIRTVSRRLHQRKEWKKLAPSWISN